MTAHPQASERYVVLDSWRGIAACCIALIHLQTGMNSHFNESDFFWHTGLFVDFFFVLSGFVIFATYAERLLGGYGFWRFMLLRFGRLWPLHVFVLGLFIGFELVQLALPQLGAMAAHPPFSQEGESAGFIVSAVLLVHALGLYDESAVSLSGPSWSISTEFYAYAFFALLLLLLKKHIRIGLAAVMLASLCFLYSHDIELIYATYRYGFIRCLYGFSAGALLWYIYAAHRERAAAMLGRLKLWTAAEAALIAGLIVLVTCFFRGTHQLLAIPLFALMVWVFSYERGLCSKILKGRAFVLLGTLSYSIYLLHGFIASKTPSLARYVAGNLSWDVVSVNEKGQEVLGATLWQGDAISLAYLGIVVAGSFVTYSIVEAPSRRFFRALAARLGRKTPAYG